MNILFLSTRYPYPPDCGHYLRTFHTLKYLAKDNKVFFLSFLEKKIDKIHPEIEKLCESVDVYLLPEDASKIRLFLSLLSNAFSPLPFVAQKYFDKRMVRQINYILDNNYIDLIHVDLLPLSEYLPFFRGITACLTEHNVEYMRVESYVKVTKNILIKFFFKIQALKLKKYEKIILSKYRKVFCVSRNDLNQLKRLSPNSNIILVPNAVDINYFHRKNYETTSKKLIWTGGAGEVYNRHAIRELVNNILPMVRKNDNEIELILIGDSIEKYFPKINNIEGIKFYGFVNDVRPYLSSASIFIAPIYAGGGTKIKILNAMAMAMAVITTEIGAEGIGCYKGIHYFEAKDTDDFVKIILSLFKNPDEIKTIGFAARKFIENNFTWDSTLKHMNYSEII